MNNLQPQYDDEIDLFELMQTIWAGKAWVILTTVISTGLGGLYIAVTPTVYETSITLRVHAGAGADADADKIFTHLQQNLELPWTVNPKTKTLIIETKTPLEPKKYTTDIKTASERATAKLLQSYKDELDQIANLSPSLLGTEAVAATVLHNQRFINTFKTRDEKIISFSSPVERVKSPNTRLVIALTFVLGGTVGALCVLIKSISQNRARKI